MTQLRGKIYGQAELDKLFADLSKALGPADKRRIIRGSLRATAKPYVEKIAGKTPVDTGKLKASASMRIRTPKGAEGIPTIYLGWFGKDIHWGQMMAVEYGTKNREAVRPIRTALDEMEGTAGRTEFVDQVLDRSGKVLADIARKQKQRLTAAKARR